MGRYDPDPRRKRRRRPRRRTTRRRRRRTYDPAPRRRRRTTFRKRVGGLVGWLKKNGAYLIGIPAFFEGVLDKQIKYHASESPEKLRAYLSNPRWMFEDFLGISPGKGGLLRPETDLGKVITNFFSLPFTYIGLILTTLGLLPISQIPQKPLLKKLGITALFASALAAPFDPAPESTSTSTRTSTSTQSNVSSHYG